MFAFGFLIIIFILIFRSHTSFVHVRIHKYTGNGMTHCRRSRFNSQLLERWVAHSSTAHIHPQYTTTYTCNDSIQIQALNAERALKYGDSEQNVTVRHTCEVK